MQVTGPKHDLWLVYTVSFILLPLGFLLLGKALCYNGHWSSLYLVAILNAASLAVADLYFSLKGIIPVAYMLDGIVQLVFVLVWSIAIILYHSNIIRLMGSKV